MLCKAVNTALGHLFVKAKLLAVLNHRGGFACPMPVESIASSTEKTNDDRVAIVVADLHKRGSARPRRVTTLKNTMNAAFQMSLSEVELEVLLARLLANGYVVVEDTKVSYALPSPSA